MNIKPMEIIAGRFCTATPLFKRDGAANYTLKMDSRHSPMIAVAEGEIINRVPHLSSEIQYFAGEQEFQAWYSAAQSA